MTLLVEAAIRAVKYVVALHCLEATRTRSHAASKQLPLVPVVTNRVAMWPCLVFMSMLRYKPNLKPHRSILDPRFKYDEMRVYLQEWRNEMGSTPNVNNEEEKARLLPQQNQVA